MTFNNEQAIMNLESKIDKAMNKKGLIIKDALKSLSDELVDRTPRYFEELVTSGNMVANWRYAANSPDTSYSTREADFGGEATKSQLRADIQSTSIAKGEDVYLTNSGEGGKLRSIEFGLYPNPPKVGSIHPITGIPEIRSEGGYSKQAPGGIIGVAALKWSEFVSDAMAKYANK